MRRIQEVILASESRLEEEQWKKLFAQLAPSIQLHSVKKWVRNPESLHLLSPPLSYPDEALSKARLVHHATHYPTLAEALGSGPYVFKKPQGLTSAQKDQPVTCYLALLIEGVCIQAEAAVESTLETARKKALQALLEEIQTRKILLAKP